MLYRLLEAKTETKHNNDISFWTDEKCYLFRPVPEPRPVDELTDGELTDLCCYSSHYFRTPQMVELLKRADEIRSRPRETEKERWIREKIADDVGLYGKGTKKILSETWDAAYEAGRRDK